MRCSITERGTHTYIHTYTHTHTQRERERERERLAAHLANPVRHAALAVEEHACCGIKALVDNDSPKDLQISTLLNKSRSISLAQSCTPIAW